MPNRMLRDWTESEKIDKLSIQAEVFFTRLIMKADDHGCLRANEKLLKSALFPLKDNIRDADMLRWMAECQKSDLIVVYEVADKRYLQIKDFGQRKRQMILKHPLPDDGQLTDNCQTTDGLKGREVEEEVEEKGNARETLSVFNAETEILKNQIRFEQLTMNGGFNSNAGREILHKYHLHLEEKSYYPKTKKSVFAGFEKWLMNEKNFQHEANRRTISTSGKTKLGTSEDRTEKLKNW